MSGSVCYLSGGKGVIGDGGRVQEQRADVRERGIAVVWVGVVVSQRHRLAGGGELFELRDGAAEPDLACRGVDVDKAERDKPTLELAVVDHQMGDGMSARVNDQATHFATEPVGTGDVSPDRQRRRPGHGHLPVAFDCSATPVSRTRIARLALLASI
jgi:hypothetical protein